MMNMSMCVDVPVSGQIWEDTVCGIVVITGNNNATNTEYGYNNCTHQMMYEEYLGRVTRSGTDREHGHYGIHCICG